MTKIFNFTVDNPKFGKRENNAGEDAPAVSSDGVIIVCDGTGATGMSKHSLDDGQVHTSAYLGSRLVSEITEKFLRESYERIFDCINDEAAIKEIASELGNRLRKGLDDFVRKYDLKINYKGKSFKLLPTTLAAAVYRAFDDRVEAVVFSAGDSRVLLWNCSGGLQQLSVDDIAEGYDAFSDLSNVTNCISANDEFCINCAVYNSLPVQGLLFATSDGFTDRLKPFEQEWWLMSNVLSEINVIDSAEGEFASALSEKIDHIGLSKMDDVSIAGVFFGYESDAQLKTSAASDRIKEVITEYVKPYKSLQKQNSEALVKYNEAAAQGRTLVSQARDVIRKRLADCADVFCPDTRNKNRAIYEVLAAQPYIASVQKTIDARQKELSAGAAEMLKTAEKKLKQAFADAMRVYYFSVAKSYLKNSRHGFDINMVHEDILDAVIRCVASEENRIMNMDVFNSSLEKIRVFRRFTFEDSTAFFMNELDAIIFALKDSLTNMSYSENTISDARMKIDRYFTFENPEFCLLYNNSQADYFGDIAYAVEQSKNQFCRYIGTGEYFIPAEKAIDYLMSCKDEYETAKKSLSCAEVPASEIRDYYKKAILEHSEELVELIFNDEILFPHFAGSSRDVLVGSKNEKELEDAVRALVEAKNAIWLKYKKGYELFAYAVKSFVQIPAESNGGAK